MFMQKLISAIQNRSNALLEAPTGCGKTLAILCGALAWQSKAKTDADEMEAAQELDIYDIALTQGDHFDCMHNRLPHAPHRRHMIHSSYVCILDLALA